MSDERTAVMQALDLLLDEAYHYGDARALAVAAEAYTLAGFTDAAIMVSHAPDVHQRVADARRGRPQRLLRHDAAGMLTAVQQLLRLGIIDGDECARVRHARWTARGGHGWTPTVAPDDGTGVDA